MIVSSFRQHEQVQGSKGKNPATAIKIAGQFATVQRGYLKNHSFISGRVFFLFQVHLFIVSLITTQALFKMPIIDILLFLCIVTSIL